VVHKIELKSYDTSKGTIRFQPERPLPAALGDAGHLYGIERLRFFHFRDIAHQQSSIRK